MQTEISIDEKIFSYKKIWQNEMDKKQEYNVDLSKVTKRQHGKFYYKYIFIMKIFMFFGSFAMIKYFFDCAVALYNTKYFSIPYVIGIIITILELYWFVLFVVRIYQININDPITIFEKKQNLILWMEKVEFIFTSITSLFAYFLLIIPLDMYYQYDNNFICYFGGFLVKRWSIILIGTVINITYYYLNIKAIKKIKDDISLENIKINLNIFRYELYTR
ncbi:MAG: hypothetical protein IJ180_01785 [Bacteroidales bacterium]|nr:hypothetical protein [Bacteroidales bacterium]